MPDEQGNRPFPSSCLSPLQSESKAVFTLGLDYDQIINELIKYEMASHQLLQSLIITGLLLQTTSKGLFEVITMRN